MTESDLRRALVRTARRLDQKGILTSVDGNLSVLLDDGSLLITPSGCCKADVEPEDLVRVRPDATVEGRGRPSSEIALHRTIYRLRSDVRAVVHAHPTHATAYAVAGIPLDQPILSEAILTLGIVPVAEYGMPTGEALARTVEPHAGGHDAILLRYHGAVCYAPTIERAGYLMETLEHVASIDFIRRRLPEAELIGAADVSRLWELRAVIRGKSGE